MIQATYKGEVEWNNTRGIILALAFSGFYGVQGVGDLLNLAPYEQSTNPGGILDPSLAYNSLLTEPPSNVGPFNENIQGYYTQVNPNAVPTLLNTGLQVFAPGGGELNTNQAYPAAMLAGTVKIIVFVPLQ